MWFRQTTRCYSCWNRRQALDSHRPLRRSVSRVELIALESDRLGIGRCLIRGGPRIMTSIPRPAHRVPDLTGRDIVEPDSSRRAGNAVIRDGDDIKIFRSRGRHKTRGEIGFVGPPHRRFPHRVGGHVPPGQRNGCRIGKTGPSRNDRSRAPRIVDFDVDGVASSVDSRWNDNPKAPGTVQVQVVGLKISTYSDQIQMPKECSPRTWLITKWSFFHTYPETVAEVMATKLKSAVAEVFVATITGVVFVK